MQNLDIAEGQKLEINEVSEVKDVSETKLEVSEVAKKPKGKSGRPRKYDNLPIWKDNPTKYMNEYYKLTYVCPACNKTLALASKSVHLKRNSHLKNLKKNESK